VDSRISILMAEEGLRRIRNGQEPQEYHPKNNPKDLPIQPIHLDYENPPRKEKSKQRQNWNRRRHKNIYAIKQKAF